MCNSVPLESYHDTQEASYRKETLGLPYRRWLPNGGGGRGNAGIGEVLDPNTCPCSGSQGHPAVEQKGRHLVTLLGTKGGSM